MTDSGNFCYSIHRNHDDVDKTFNNNEVDDKDNVDDNDKNDYDVMIIIMIVIMIIIMMMMMMDVFRMKITAFIVIQYRLFQQSYH